jgi:hypothetical protein
MNDVDAVLCGERKGIHGEYRPALASDQVEQFARFLGHLTERTFLG